MTTEDRNKRKEEMLTLAHELIEKGGGSPDSFESELVSQMILNCVKLLSDDYTTSQLKLMNRAFKEIRYAYKTFSRYSSPGKRLSIFGSARTPEDHPDYLAAKNFSAAMAEKDWICITGAAHGIMKAGHEGTNIESSFGLAIKIAFESTINPLIEGDPKLINFRYFFTRKLIFLSHSDAIAVFPGGVGTLDELYEILTLMQTGKSALVPVVMLEGEKGTYWESWLNYFNNALLANGLVSADDRNFFYFASSEEDAVQHIEQFYRRYHSMRYVNDELLIRLRTPLTEAQVDRLNDQFSSLVKSGQMRQEKPPTPTDLEPDLPRLVFHYTRRDFGTLRLLIDEINAQ